MAQKIPIFRGSSGINNIDDPAQLGFPESGIQQLPVGTDIDIDKNFRVSRRKGYEEVHSVGLDSIFNFRDKILVGKYRLNSGTDQWVYTFDGTSWVNTTQTTNMGRLNYLELNGEVYWMNNIDKGIINIDIPGNGLIFSDWINQAYVGPDTTMELYDPPVGHLMFIFNGRLYIAKDNVLWYSRPFAYSWFRMATDYIPFDSRIRMCKPVDDGIFVSTDTQTIFLRGSTPDNFEYKVRANYPAVEFTDQYFSGDNLNTDIVGAGYDSDIAIWASTKGICLGFPDGSFRNITKKKLAYDSADVGSSVVWRDKYICVT